MVGIPRRIVSLPTQYSPGTDSSRDCGPPQCRHAASPLWGELMVELKPSRFD